MHFSIIILYILCCILYTALPFYSTRLHYLLHIARFHSVCTGDFIVHSTILSVWYRITVLHIKLKYTVLHRKYTALRYTTLNWSRLHWTEVHCTTPHRMICSPQCFRLQVSWGFRPRLSSTPTTPTLSTSISSAISPSSTMIIIIKSITEQHHTFRREFL